MEKPSYNTTQVSFWLEFLLQFCYIWNKDELLVYQKHVFVFNQEVDAPDKCITLLGMKNHINIIDNAVSANIHYANIQYGIKEMNTHALIVFVCLFLCLFVLKRLRSIG